MTRLKTRAADNNNIIMRHTSRTFTNVTTLSLQAPSHVIEGPEGDCIDFFLACQVWICILFVSLSSLSIIARHQYPTPLLYPVHSIKTSISSSDPLSIDFFSTFRIPHS